MPKSNKSDSPELVKTIIEGIEEKKGLDIVCLDLKKIDSAVCDYFVICTGTSDRHVDALASSVEEFAQKKLKEKPNHIEGLENLEWVLIDYFDVLVHIFTEETRDFYKIEELWADAEEVKLN